MLHSWPPQRTLDTIILLIQNSYELSRTQDRKTMLFNIIFILKEFFSIQDNEEHKEYFSVHILSKEKNSRNIQDGIVS